MCDCKRFGVLGVVALALAAGGVATLQGCAVGTREPTASGSAAAKAEPAASGAGDADADIAAERGKLAPEDRRLVDAQEFCAVMNDSRLGSMGPPIKVMVKDVPVFVCCKGCQKKAAADPDKTLAKVEELKSKVKAANPSK